MKNYKKLKIWEIGMQIARMTYEVVEELPAEERYGLRSQMTRSAVSIPSNVAEGSAQSSDKANRKYIEIALGSAFELETQLLITEDLKMIESSKLTKLKNLLEEEQKMLHGFAARLTANS